MEQKQLGKTRLLLGLIQGIILYFLFLALSHHTWPATNHFVFMPLLLIFLFVPFILIQGLGYLQPKKLLIWAGTTTFLLTGFGYYGAWNTFSQTEEIQILNTGYIYLIFIGLFIAHSLIISSSIDNRFRAQYTTYFDIAWKMALQLILSSFFVGIFWGLLWLCAELFKAIGISVFTDILVKQWFYIPVITLAFASVLHLTDVKSSMIRGIRTVVLMLLSWLLPIITIAICGFLISLIFSGVKILLATHPTSLLLGSALWLIILINTVYQDGRLEASSSALLRYSGKLAAIALLPLIVIAGSALSLRVAQYGWTVDRVYAMSLIFIAAFYALGYAIAAFKSGPWLKFIEVWNFSAALLIIFIAFLFLTPIANPSRLSVLSQIARLEGGKVEPSKFDFDYLHQYGKRYGKDALIYLQHMPLDKPNAAYIQQQALAALQFKRSTSERHIIIHTQNGKLPDSFMKQKKWPNYSKLPACLNINYVTCDAWLMDINQDGKNEIIILEDIFFTGFQENAQGSWEVIGSWEVARDCAKSLSSVKTDGFKLVTPLTPIWPDIKVNGQRLYFQPNNPCTYNAN